MKPIIILLFFFLGCSLQEKEMSNKILPLVPPPKGEVTNCSQTHLSKQFDVSFNFQRFEFDERDSF